MAAPVRPANWAGNVTFHASQVHRPSTVDELRRLVAGARRLRPLGTAHSFNRIADTSGVLISVADLPAEVHIDADRRRVRVPAGMRYGELVAHLDRVGLALPSMASLPHISVAGACATGTHGSGDRVGSLATAVIGLELVTVDGSLRWLDRGDGRFPGAVVHLGALGVVTRLELAVVPAFEVRQDVYEQLPFEVFADRFDEVFASAYSVSAFTCWRGDTVEQVWRKRRAGDRPAAGGAAGSAAPARWLGARLADGPRHPVPGAVAAHCTEQQGVPGPWYARLPHFRLEFTPSAGHELQSEYLLPREHAGAALAALHRIRDRVAPALQVSEVRTVAADDLWLSPCYGRDTVAVHFTWVADQAAVAPAMAAVEEALAPFAPRPHWGKLFAADPAALGSRYPRWRDFTALADELDPDGTLRNDFLTAVLGPSPPRQ